MAQRIAKHTVAEWNGNELIIHWFGMRSEPDEVGAYYRSGERPALIFDGLSETKAWPMAEKPTAERALELIQNWQNYR
jgi:hypothetical protein